MHTSFSLFTGPTDLSMKSLASNSSTSSTNSLGRSGGGGGGTSTQLSHTEVTAVRQLIAGYRESAAFLLRSADELENLILQQNWPAHSPTLLIATFYLSQSAFIFNSRSITSGLYFPTSHSLLHCLRPLRRTHFEDIRKDDEASISMPLHLVCLQREKRKGAGEGGSMLQCCVEEENTVPVGGWPCESYASPPPCP